ncbi:MAG: tetratricopeptide repeat protein [Deltaproteobacteria bacterium]|nr:tetratricopeptide repeat protein [Deltaproteobacteria bacterium]
MRRFLRSVPFHALALVIALSPLEAFAHRALPAQLRALNQAILRRPRDVRLRLDRAFLYGRMGEHAHALEDLARARRLAPKDREVDLATAECYAGMGRTREAEQALARFFQRGLGTGRAFALRARLHATAGRRKEAVADYDRAIPLAPQPELYVERGRLQEAQGELAAAAAGYAEGLRRLGGAVVLRLALVRVEVARGGFGRARALVEEVLKSVPVRADWLLRRAAIAEAEGQRGAVLADVKTAVVELDALLATRATAFGFYRRARAKLALGDRSGAVADLRAALGLVPDHAASRKALQAVQAGVPPDLRSLLEDTD